VKLINSIEELESLVLKHGENIVDMIGAEIDRIEKELKVMKRIIVLFLVARNTYH
jgi:zinc transporter 9